MSILFILTISGYILCLFLLSAFFVKRALHSYEEYAYCGRQLTISFIIFTYLGTWIGGGTIIGLSGSAAKHGASQYWIFALSCIIGYVFALLFIRQIRRGNFQSIGDLMAARYPEMGGLIRIPTVISLLIRNITMIGMQFTALAFLLTFVFHIDINLALLVTFIAITGYTCLSGLWAVVSTDVVQGFLQTIGMILLLAVSLKLCGGLDNVAAYYRSSGDLSHINILFPQASPSYLLLYSVCFGLFFLMGDESDWIRIYSAKTSKSAFWGYLIPLTITLLLLILPAYIGIFDNVIARGSIDANQLLYWVISNKVGKFLMIFFLLAVISAIMSTCDSYLQACGALFSNVLIRRFINKEASDRELIFWSCVSMIVCGAAGFAFSINLHNIVRLWILGISIASIIIVPEYLCAWFSRILNTKGALWGSAFGIIYCVITLFIDSRMSLMTVLGGIIGNTLISYLVSFLTRDKTLNIRHNYYMILKALHPSAD